MPARIFLSRAPGLIAALALLLAGCSSSAADSAPVSVSPAPVVIKVERVAPSLELSAPSVRQGGVLTIAVRGAELQEGLVILSSHTYRLTAVAGGLWVAIGIGAEEAAGLAPLTAMFSDDAGQNHRLVGTVTVLDYEFPLDNVYLPPGATSGIDAGRVAQESRIIATTFRGFTPAWNGIPREFQWPIVGAITTTFGEGRVYNGNMASITRHSGTDIAADEGDPVQAAAAGLVAFAGPVATRGEYIIIDHGMGVFTGYGHLSQLSVQTGDPVTADTIIGLVGTTGLSTGPHLHWEAVAQGVFFDPQELLNGALRNQIDSEARTGA